MEKGLYDTLVDYSHEDILPLHMPGHKRNPKFEMHNPYGLDVTEVRGMDNLHHPEGVIKRLMERVAQMYHSDCSYLLVNGSTCGLLSAIAACCRHGDRILVARNCHKAVYNAIKLLGLRPVYVYPDSEGGEKEHLHIAGIIRADSVEEALGNFTDVACVVITSPTYEGVVSPIAEIARRVHDYHIPLIVDEAHGAHFNWHEAFPDTALSEGADIVVESLHKTLPSFTQTGVLHVKSRLVDRERLSWSLQAFQSSSPSYLLMAGIDRCFAYIEDRGREDFEKYVRNLKSFKEWMKERKHLYLFDSSHKEDSKLVIATDRSSISGKELADILFDKYKIETEMSCGEYCVAMTSVCDEESSFKRLADALWEIDDGISGKKSGGESGCPYLWNPPEIGMYSFETWNCERESVRVKESVGRMAAVDICLYPPGIPLVVEGEVISAETVAVLISAEKAGYTINGVKDGIVDVLKK